MNWKDICSELDNTLVILILGVIAIYSLYLGYKDIALTTSGGLIGYLTKTVKDKYFPVLKKDEDKQEGK